MSKELPEHLRNLPPATNLGGAKIRVGQKSKLGSCNFCDRDNYTVVHELSGDRLMIRLCNECLRVVQKYRP
jgi:hypothetical protein